MRTTPDYIRGAIIGANTAIETPFGTRPLVYADYTASGRSLTFIEERIRHEVLPHYANTHSESAFTGARTTAVREQARDEIRRAVNASDEDAVIFCGTGATAAINKLVAAQVLAERADETVVFIGPYEHHSNELPWRESGAHVVRIALDERGGIDREDLDNKLSQFGSYAYKIGSFSAASNVTGILSDVPGITRLLKRHGALACWDYAAAAPYVTIDMNGEYPLDAAYISPHKFVGGPGSAGVLIAKRRLLEIPTPTTVGGGTVSFVSPTHHRYVDDIERREEAGTPGIIESIRAGMVFRLQQEVGLDVIREHEETLSRSALSAFSAMPDVEVLGDPTADRLPIFALRFRHGEDELPYGFVVSLLNDLFGIQARGGCSCAGPYGHALLGIDSAESERLEEEVVNGNMLARPGWVRLGFTYFMSDEDVGYILRAVELIAECGWKLLGEYEGDALSGTWGYRGFCRSHAAGAEGFFRGFGSGSNHESRLESLQDAMNSAEAILAGGSPADCEKEGLRFVRSGSGRLAGA